VKNESDLRKLNQPDLVALIERCRPVVRTLIQEQGRETEPFRDRFEHTLRVLYWARRIQKYEGGSMDVISLAVLFHDTGWSEVINHSQVSASLAKKYLQEENVPAHIVERVVSAVKTHNLRDLPGEELTIENKIVMDADLLDETGVTTLVWDAMAISQDRDASYLRVYEKDRGFYSQAMKLTGCLKTETGQKLYLERMEIWGVLLDNLAFELGLSTRAHDHLDASARNST
jgi:uncharacterized protein